MPLIQRLVARNWNLAISGLDFTASRVAKSVAVSTPLRIGVSVVVMTGTPFLVSVVLVSVSGLASVDARTGPTVARATLAGIRAQHGSATD